jgi:hypothetical protein
VDVYKKLMRTTACTRSERDATRVVDLLISWIGLLPSPQPGKLVQHPSMSSCYSWPGQGSYLDKSHGRLASTCASTSHYISFVKPATMQQVMGR